MFFGFFETTAAERGRGAGINTEAALFSSPPEETWPLQQLELSILSSLENSGARANNKRTKVRARRVGTTHAVANAADEIRHRWRGPPRAVVTPLPLLNVSLY